MLLLVPGERIAAAYKGVGFERSFQVWMVVVLTLRAARDVAGVCRPEAVGVRAGGTDGGGEASS